MRKNPGVEDLGLFRVIGQPNLSLKANGREAARYGLTADVQDAIQTAAGGSVLTQGLQGERRFDLVRRYLAPFRNTKEAMESVRLFAHQ
jgi:heavy metal efflux system protein